MSISISPRTVVASSFEEYVASCQLSAAYSAEIQHERCERMERFPYAVMLQVSYPELDFANRWCWHRFGPADGECHQSDSEYPACDRTEQHSHIGKWTTRWFEKTDYDFGFNEWYFMQRSDRDLFLSNLSEINWGELYPK